MAYPKIVRRDVDLDFLGLGMVAAHTDFTVIVLVAPGAIIVFTVSSAHVFPVISTALVAFIALVRTSSGTPT